MGIGEADLSQDSPLATLFIQVARPNLMLKLIGLVLLAQAISARAQQGPIEPTWIYTTPLHWKHAPRGFNLSSSSARIVVLYPEGQYFDAGLVLIKTDKRIAFSAGDGHVLRTGTWSRTDEHVIRIKSRVVLRDVEIVGQSLPGPITIDTCGLEGEFPTHLAKTIHCKQLILQPSRLNLDLPELQRMAAQAFAGTPKP